MDLIDAECVCLNLVNIGLCGCVALQLEPAGGTTKNSNYSVKIKFLTLRRINCYDLRNKWSSDERLCLKARCQTFAFCRASHKLRLKVRFTVQIAVRASQIWNSNARVIYAIVVLWCAHLTTEKLMIFVHVCRPEWCVSLDAHTSAHIYSWKFIPPSPTCLN